MASFPGATCVAALAQPTNSCLAWFAHPIGMVEVGHRECVELVDFGYSQYVRHTISGEVLRVYSVDDGGSGGPWQLRYNQQGMAGLQACDQERQLIAGGKFWWVNDLLQVGCFRDPEGDIFLSDSAKQVWLKDCASEVVSKVFASEPPSGMPWKAEVYVHKVPKHEGPKARVWWTASSVVDKMYGQDRLNNLVGRRAESWRQALEELGCGHRSAGHLRDRAGKPAA